MRNIDNGVTTLAPINGLNNLRNVSPTAVALGAALTVVLSGTPEASAIQQTPANIQYASTNPASEIVFDFGLVNSQGYSPLNLINPQLKASPEEVQKVQAKSSCKVNTALIVDTESIYRNELKQTCQQTEAIKALICETFGKYCLEALVISLHESEFYRNAKSNANALGVMQIHCASHKRRPELNGDCSGLKNPSINTLIAWSLFKGDNFKWKQWHTKTWLPRNRQG